ncbi:hypothetical protein GIX45_23970 [Erwinia sp. CPCC 100877]|nr:hypothetical protein [Erwinia sp. CPCC 100877]
MKEFTVAFENNPLFAIGCLLVVIGILTFGFGKKFFVFRWLFGDRSMFTQILGGIILSGIGLMLIIFFKAQ